MWPFNNRIITLVCDQDNEGAASYMGRRGVPSQLADLLFFEPFYPSCVTNTSYKHPNS